MADLSTPEGKLVERLRDACKGVTPGKWHAKIWRHTGHADTVCIHDDNAREIVAWTGFDGLDCTKAEIRANARFIAASDPEAVNTLLNALNTAERERDELKAEVERLREALRG